METTCAPSDLANAVIAFSALHEARGVPARILKSRDEAAQDAQARAQQQQMAQMMEMAQQGAGALKDAAQAGVLPAADGADPAAQGAPAQ